MRTTASVCCLVATLALAPTPAAARETPHILPVKTAVESEMGQAHLLDVPFYFAGQKHPAVAKKIQQASYEHVTRGAFRSDEESCKVALLSAIRDLQERAQQEGADAIVDLVSITMDRKHESATEYRCVAGAFVVRVGLRGTLVKLK